MSRNGFKHNGSPPSPSDIYEHPSGHKIVICQFGNSERNKAVLHYGPNGCINPNNRLASQAIKTLADHNFK
jgi:hypothetical protein